VAKDTQVCCAVQEIFSENVRAVCFPITAPATSCNGSNIARRTTSIVSPVSKSDASTASSDRPNSSLVLRCIITVVSTRLPMFI
jgi:hypothetical protein